MGYYFSPVDHGPGFDIPGFEMADVREAIRMAVSLDPGPCPVEMHKFESNDRWHVTPEECEALAGLLEEEKAASLVSTYLSFVDEADPNLLSNLRALGRLAARSASGGGLHVS